MTMPHKWEKALLPLCGVPLLKPWNATSKSDDLGHRAVHYEMNALCPVFIYSYNSALM